MNAAQLGNKEAQYRAYLLLKNKQVINNSNQTAFYWLTQAAQKDFPNAQLEYAKHVSTSDINNDEQLKLAAKYLKNYGNSTITTPDWYLTKALLEAKNGKTKKAKRTLKKAISHAKKTQVGFNRF